MLEGSINREFGDMQVQPVAADRARDATRGGSDHASGIGVAHSAGDRVMARHGVVVAACLRRADRRSGATW